MPVRKVSNRGGNVIGHLPCLTLSGKMVDFESPLERDHLMLIDQSQNVVWFDVQPVEIRYRHNGKDRRYTPDVLEKDKTGHYTLVEVKPAILVDTEENKMKFAAARAWCAERGYTFKVVTDTDIRGGFRLKNVKLLTQFARHGVAPETRARVFGLLAHGPMTIAALVTAVCPSQPSTALIAILHLAYHHEIAAPLDEARLDMDTLVRLPYQTLRKGEG